MVTWLEPPTCSAPVVAATRCTAILRGALPTATVCIAPPARSTTLTSLEPSLLTHSFLPSADRSSQCGCLPTPMLRTEVRAAGSNSMTSPGPGTTTTPLAMPAKCCAMCGDTPVGTGAPHWLVVASSTCTAGTPASVR